MFACLPIPALKNKEGHKAERVVPTTLSNTIGGIPEVVDFAWHPMNNMSGQGAAQSIPAHMGRRNRTVMWRSRKAVYAGASPVAASKPTLNIVTSWNGQVLLKCAKGDK